MSALQQGPFLASAVSWLVFVCYFLVSGPVDNVGLVERFVRSLCLSCQLAKQFAAGLHIISLQIESPEENICT
jgi:hypothetical protein